MTLWPVPEGTTTLLTEAFYTELKPLKIADRFVVGSVTA